jgi:protein-L-isoaspartate(D-aspartate) O-methyltransferase
MPRSHSCLRNLRLTTRRSLTVLAVVFSATLGFLYAAGPEDDRYAALRLKMVAEQIAREGIRNEAVLKAMREVPRHLFVNEDVRNKAYTDQVITIGYKQTLSPAYIVAYETEAIDPKPTDRVLEIGTGSGYQAAVLSKIVKEVYTIEIIAPLGKQASARLKDLGYSNVQTKIGDGYKGWPEFAPFDKILVTCSPEDIPQPLVDQLKEGGKMIIPLGERFQQCFYLAEKHQGKLIKQKLLPTLFVPMTGMADKERKAHYDPAHPALLNGSFETSNNGLPDSWYYVRQATLQHQVAPHGKPFLTFANSEPGRIAQALQGFGINGSKVKKLRVSLWVQAEQIVPGEQSFERPFLAVHYYDTENRQVRIEGLGPWLGTLPWKRYRSDLDVPPQAHMAVLLIGMNGATGRMSVADISVKAIPR